MFLHQQEWAHSFKVANNTWDRTHFTHSSHYAGFSWAFCFCCDSCPSYVAHCCQASWSGSPFPERHHACLTSHPFLLRHFALACWLWLRVPSNAPSASWRRSCHSCFCLSQELAGETWTVTSYVPSSSLCLDFCAETGSGSSTSLDSYFDCDFLICRKSTKIRRQASPIHIVFH